MRLNVYVPKPDRLPQIQPGAGIIGTDRHDNPMRILVDYEDNRSAAVNIRILWNLICQVRATSTRSTCS